MAFFSWRKDYEVGVQQIDTEHRGLFDLINEFHEGYTRGVPGREIAQLLNRLVAYAEEHFQHEEKLMAENDYPRLDAHKGQHADLVTAVFAINERLADDKAQASAETVRFVKNWLIDHILKEDMDFADYLRRKNNQAKKANENEAAAKAAEKSPPAPAEKAKAGAAK